MIARTLDRVSAFSSSRREKCVPRRAPSHPTDALNSGAATGMQKFIEKQNGGEGWRWSTSWQGRCMVSWFVDRSLLLSSSSSSLRLSTIPSLIPRRRRRPFAFRHSRAGWKGTKKDPSSDKCVRYNNDRRETTKTAIDRPARLRPTFLSDRRNEDYLCTTREGEGRLAFLSINRARNRLAVCLFFFLSFRETDLSSVHRWVKAESSLYS